MITTTIKERLSRPSEVMIKATITPSPINPDIRKTLSPNVFICDEILVIKVAPPPVKVSLETIKNQMLPAANSELQALIAEDYDNDLAVLCDDIVGVEIRHAYGEVKLSVDAFRKLMER